MSMVGKLSLLALGGALCLAQAPLAAAQDLAGAPYAAPQGGYAEAAAHPKECFARVKYGAAYAPPPTGPQYVWRQAPAPPGAPGPVWCLVAEPASTRPVMIAPERMGWIRVLCDDEATPGRVIGLQQRLYQRGLYRGAFDGRYDLETARAVARFQQQAHIAHYGYLSYRTVSAIEALPPPRPEDWRAPTTFDTGVIDWPGKIRRF